jgi:hypothetical protein
MGVIWMLLSIFNGLECQYRKVRVCFYYDIHNYNTHVSVILCYMDVIMFRLCFDVLVFLVGRVLPLLFHDFPWGSTVQEERLKSDTWTLKVYKILVMSKDKCEHTKVSGQLLCFVLF